MFCLVGVAPEVLAEVAFQKTQLKNQQHHLNSQQQHLKRQQQHLKRHLNDLLQQTFQH